MPIVPVKPELIAMIKLHIGDRTRGLIMTNKKGNPFRNTVVLRRHLHPLLHKLGIAQAGMHAFRHGRVSVLVEAGTPRDVIKRRIGHGSDRMIDLYLHLRKEWQEAELAKLPTMIPRSSGGSLAASSQVS
jgi:integrase